MIRGPDGKIVFRIPIEENAKAGPLESAFLEKRTVKVKRRVGR